MNDSGRVTGANWSRSVSLLALTPVVSSNNPAACSASNVQTKRVAVPCLLVFSVALSTATLPDSMRSLIRESSLETNMALLICLVLSFGVLVCWCVLINYRPHRRCCLIIGRCGLLVAVFQGLNSLVCLTEQPANWHTGQADSEDTAADNANT